MTKNKLLAALGLGKPAAAADAPEDENKPETPATDPAPAPAPETPPATPEQDPSEDEVAAMKPIVAAARAAERARVGAILGHAEAAGRETLARHLAFDGDTSPEQAAAILAAAPKSVKPSGLAAAMAGVTIPDIGPGAAKGDPTSPAARAAWAMAQKA